MAAWAATMEVKTINADLSFFSFSGFVNGTTQSCIAPYFENTLRRCCSSMCWFPLRFQRTLNVRSISENLLLPSLPPSSFSLSPSTIASSSFFSSSSSDAAALTASSLFLLNSAPSALNFSNCWRNRSSASSPFALAFLAPLSRLSSSSCIRLRFTSNASFLRFRANRALRALSYAVRVAGSERTS